MSDIFKVFQDEVFSKGRDNGSGQPGQSRMVKEAPEPKMNYLLLGFKKTEDPFEIWNYGLNNSCTQKEMTISQLEDHNCDFVMYEIEEPEDKELKLVMVEYKYKKFVFEEKTIGLPRFLYCK